MKAESKQKTFVKLTVRIDYPLDVLKKYYAHHYGEK